MKPVIIHSQPITLAGFSFFGDPFAESSGWKEENEIGRVWNRFMVFLSNKGADIHHIQEASCFYEVHINHPETATTGHVEVFVGIQVSQLQEIPVELSIKRLPESQYAVFTLEGELIASDWYKLIYEEWLPASGYLAPFPYMFELYDQRFKGIDRLDESVIEAHIPIQPKC